MDNNKIDIRNKVARANEQEYAHQYTPKDRSDDYQYPNENERVTYHVKDIDDEKTIDKLYGVEPEQIFVTTTTECSNRIRARMKAKEIAEEHRQRAYKIKSKPPIYDKTDLDIDTFQNQNDPRKDEINKIKETSKAFSDKLNEENSKDLTNPTERYAIDPVIDGEDDCVPNFKVGDKVVHVEEGITGEVKFVNDKRLAVVWEDNTRERFSIADAKQFLQIKEAYVDPVQEQVDPIHTTPFPKNEKLENKINNALSSVESEEDNTVEDIDIEKVKLKRKVSDLEEQIKQIDVEKIKRKAAEELITLMQKKGMLGNSEEEIQEQLSNIMSMDDTAFEAFKKAVMSAKKATSEEEEIYALLGEDDDFSDIEDGIEYTKTKEAMKQVRKASAVRSIDGIEMGDTSFLENGGLANFKGVVGDFSTALAASVDNTSETQSRSLSSIARKHKTIERKADSHNGLDYSGFQNIQGLKVPINIPNKEITLRGRFAELFESLDWSGVPKRK